jgi:hypothetical protein
MSLRASLDLYPAYELCLGRPSNYLSFLQMKTLEEELDSLVDREQ